MFKRKCLKKGLLIIISGPSGVGKGTIRRQVMTDRSLRLVYSISMTTRSRRPHEREGFDYYFVSREEFDKSLARNEFLEWAEFVGNRYGTPATAVEKLRNEGMNVILEIEVEGAKQVMQKVRDDHVLTIFLIPPSFEALKERITRRSTEPEAIINERLEKAKREMVLQNEYDFVVLNDSVKRASAEIQKIIRTRIRQLAHNESK
ncbi:MAG TPA: guanylate kinase [Firmicutes bacterium]|jgi:guanylate kinase|nr:guanylate kinase [Bacillota bacterium]HAV19654.1 guanylate kinase [Bacillota bacterium]